MTDIGPQRTSGLRALAPLCALNRAVREPSTLLHHRGSAIIAFVTTAEIIATKAKELPPDAQREVLDFVEFLQDRALRRTPHPSLCGIWSDLGIDLSADDIDEVRREAWAEFPRRDI
jgi:hypothetical protein